MAADHPASVPSTRVPIANAAIATGSANGEMRRIISRSGATAVPFPFAESQVHEVDRSTGSEHDPHRGEDARVEPEQPVGQVAEAPPHEDPPHQRRGDRPTDPHAGPSAVASRTRHGRGSISAPRWGRQTFGIPFPQVDGLISFRGPELVKDFTNSASGSTRVAAQVFRRCPRARIIATVAPVRKMIVAKANTCGGIPTRVAPNTQVGNIVNGPCVN